MESKERQDDSPIEESIRPEDIGDLPIRQETPSHEQIKAHKESMIDKIIKQEIAEEQAAEQGEGTEEKKHETHPKKTILDSLKGVSVSKTNDEDTLVNIHVNNPMKRVIALLEEIKKQKAFSFTLRGSLGIMGVFLTLSVFGIFGGGKILCDRGLQTKTGILRELQVTEEHTNPDIPWTKAMLQRLFGVSTPITRQRVVLISTNESPIHLFMTLKEKPAALQGQQVIATGSFNSCSNTLSIPNEQSLEVY